MSLLCACPIGAEIADIYIDPCFENIGQIQKLVFQRVLDDSGALNTITALSDPTLLATWTPLLAAVDSTKVVQTPFLSAPETEPGEARTFGGGNATLGGVPIILGANPTAFTGMFLRTNQRSIRDMKLYMCENVGVWIVDEFGRIWANTDGLDPVVNYYPIPIEGLFIGDKDIGGFEEPDSNMISFSFKANWSDNIRAITPADFSALRDLVTP